MRLARTAEGGWGRQSTGGVSAAEGKNATATVVQPKAASRLVSLRRAHNGGLLVHEGDDHTREDGVGSVVGVGGGSSGIGRDDQYASLVASGGHPPGFPAGETEGAQGSSSSGSSNKGLARKKSKKEKARQRKQKLFAQLAQDAAT